MASYQRYRTHYQPQPTRSPIDTLLSLTPLDPVVQKHLRKVYTSLSLSLLVASLGAYVQITLSINLPFIFAILCVGLAIYFSKLAPHSPRRTPVFYGFAFAEGLAIGPLLTLVAHVDQRLPLMAFLATASIFVCFSISAIFAKRRSFLYLGAFLSTALMGLFWLGMINIFARSMMAFSVQLYGGLLMFCGFVLYDSQLIIEKAHEGERDHLKHAFDLFVDFIAIFRHVLIIMARNSQQRQKKDEKRRNSN